MVPLPTRPVAAGIYSRSVAIFSGHSSVGVDFARKKANDYKCL
jgi:hypothetical protein